MSTHRAIYLLLVLGCNPLVPKAKTCRLGDVIKFEFKERNLFYSSKCSDIGEVVDFVTISNNTSYLVRLRCVDDSYHSAWIDAEDIVEVLELEKSRNKSITQ